MSANPPRVAILWQRFGPYHYARLAGARTVLRPEGLSAIGVEVAKEDDYAWDKMEAGDLDVSTIFPSRNYAELSRSQIRKGVMKTLDELRPRAVAINGWSVPEACAALAWCARHRVPHILMSETHETSGVWWKEWAKRFRIRSFGAALVGGRWHTDYLISLGFDRAKIFVGYDAVDNDHFSRGTIASIAGGPAIPRRYFFANCRFIPRKNIDGVLRAYRRYLQLAGASATWDLAISGSGEYEEQYKALTMELDIPDRVHWPGFLQYAQLPTWYQQAGCFVHAAHREAWGLVLNEACAAGLPIIAASRVGAACELVQADENGWLIESRNVEALAATMLEASTLSEERRRQFSECSRRLVEKLSASRFGQALRQALETMGVLSESVPFSAEAARSAC